MKRKHADLIHAWADGKTIQVEEPNGTWTDVEIPNWYEHNNYRIKPEPIPDIVRDFYLESNPLIGLRFSQAHTPIDLRGREFGSIRCTFDGETQRLKKAEVI